MSCRCHGASPEPCEWCQWAEDYHPACGVRYEACTCTRCDVCDDYADHDTEGHLFDAGSLYCFNLWGCELDVEHYHVSQELANKIKGEHTK